MAYKVSQLRKMDNFQYMSPIMTTASVNNETVTLTASIISTYINKESPYGTETVYREPILKLDGTSFNRQKVYYLRFRVRRLLENSYKSGLDTSQSINMSQTDIAENKYTQNTLQLRIFLLTDKNNQTITEDTEKELIGNLTVNEFPVGSYNTSYWNMKSNNDGAIFTDFATVFSPTKDGYDTILFELQRTGFDELDYPRRWRGNWEEMLSGANGINFSSIISDASATLNGLSYNSRSSGVYDINGLPTTSTYDNLQNMFIYLNGTALQDADYYIKNPSFTIPSNEYILNSLGIQSNSAAYNRYKDCIIYGESPSNEIEQLRDLLRKDLQKALLYLYNIGVTYRNKSVNKEKVINTTALNQLREWLRIEFLAKPIQISFESANNSYTSVISSTYQYDTNPETNDYFDLYELTNIVASSVSKNKNNWLNFGYQSRPGCLIVVNGEPIIVGRSGIYEINNGTKIKSFMLAGPNNEIDSFLLDYAYEG